MKPQKNGFDQAVAHFLQAHPEELSGIEYVTLKEGEPRELIMRTSTGKRFMVWALAHYPAKHPERLAPLLSFITQVEHGELTPTTEENNWIFQK